MTPFITTSRVDAFSRWITGVNRKEKTDEHAVHLVEQCQQRDHILVAIFVGDSIQYVARMPEKVEIH